MEPASQHPTERLTEPEVLHFETSPFGTIDAIVQQDGRSVYFYLNETPTSDGSVSPTGFGTRACWVRNLGIGPLVIDEDEMKQGISPMLPRTHCVHREAQPTPGANALHVVWFEEGNGAALIESKDDLPGTILAVIPPWSGLEGFHGYAAECAIESPLCWPLPDNPRLAQRIERARQFWDQWERPQPEDGKASGNHRPDSSTESSNDVDSPGDPFSELQPRILADYQNRFLSKSTADPVEPNYFSIDGGKFPPCGLVHYRFKHESVLATVGMSVCPQPAVELFTEQPMNYRRIELAIRIKKEADQTTESFNENVDSVSRQLSGLVVYPWTHLTWFGPGHTCGLTHAAPGCSVALLVNDRQLNPSSDLPSFRNDPVNLLWLVPITAAEQAELENKSTTVDQILKTR